MLLFLSLFSVELFSGFTIHCHFISHSFFFFHPLPVSPVACFPLTTTKDQLKNCVSRDPRASPIHKLAVHHHKEKVFETGW